MKSKAKVGQMTRFGRILAVLPAKGKNRSKRVLVRCFCGKLFVGRYSDVRIGKTKSCGHLSRRHWKRLKNTIIKSLSANERLRIFGLAQELGRPAAAAQSGRLAHEIGVIWWHECERLAALPYQIREDVYTIAQQSVKKAMTLFKLTRWEVLRICFVYRKEHQSTIVSVSSDTNLDRSLEQAMELGLVLDPKSPECDALLESMQGAITNAVSRLKASPLLRGCFGGEFSQAEFATAERSRYGWVFEALNGVKEIHVERCFGNDGLTFLRTCRVTRAARTARRVRFIKELRSGATPNHATTLEIELGRHRAKGLDQRQSKRSDRHRAGRLADGKRFERSNHPVSIIEDTITYVSLLDAEQSKGESRRIGSIELSSS